MLNPRSLIQALHRFPHLNTTLNRVNSTFDSRSEAYLESLGLLASVPALLLITSLSLLLLYLVTRCCDGEGRRGGVGCCVKFVLVLVAVGCCSTCSLGLYGNDDLHNALSTVIGSVRSVDLFIRHLSVATAGIEGLLGSSVPTNISTLANVFERPLLNRTAYTELQVALDHLRRNVSWTRANVELLNDKHFNLIDSNQYFRLFEAVRWPSTVAMESVFIVLNLLLLYAVGRGSRCSFITFSVLGLLALILNWSLVSVYLVVTVATADICTAPARVISVEVPALTGVSRDLLSYYIECGDRADSPLLPELGFIAGCVEATRVVLKGLKDDAVRFYDVERVTAPIESIMDQLHSIDMTLQDLEAADCQQPHAEYKRAVEVGCGGGIVGLAMLLASAFGSAFLFTVAVGFDSHAWIYLQRRGGGGGVKNGGSAAGKGNPPPPCTTGKPPRNGYEQEQAFLPPQQYYGQHYGTQPRGHGARGPPPAAAGKWDQAMVSTRL